MLLWRLIDTLNEPRMKDMEGSQKSGKEFCGPDVTEQHETIKSNWYWDQIINPFTYAVITASTKIHIQAQATSISKATMKINNLALTQRSLSVILSTISLSPPKKPHRISGNTKTLLNHRLRAATTDLMFSLINLITHRQLLQQVKVSFRSDS